MIEEFPKRFNRIKKVLMYSRFDPDEQYSPTFEEQENVMQKWVDRYGYEVVDRVRETCSGMLDEYSRPVYFAAKRQVHNMSKTLLLVSDYDRVSLDCRTVCSMIESKTSHFVTAENGYHVDTLFAQLKAVMREETWRKSVVTMGGNPSDPRHKVSEAGRKFFLQERVGMARRLQQEGQSPQQIADYYNRLRIPTQRGPDWTEEEISEMFQSCLDITNSIR